MEEKPHSFSPDRLNDAFGFATIVAGIDSCKHVFAHPFLQINWFEASFLVYFFIFRTKMYLDDAAHSFDNRRKLDLWTAVASWIAFVISGSSIEVDKYISISWFIIGLIISLFWIVISYVNSDHRAKLRIYALANILHCGLLLWAIYSDRALPFIVGIVLVAGECAVEGRHRSQRQ